jgi:protein gp37
MADKSKIQWTDATWNIARGCSKVDSDCKYCYMYRESLNNTRYEPTKVVRTKGVFSLPLRLKEPSKIFTSSLTDFFHEDIDSYREEAWEIIRKCPQHTFQILTKRPERILANLPADWGTGYKNVWLGTSVGSQNSVHRIDQLCDVPARIRFVSFEPLHSHIYEGFVNPNIDWIIIGGESGNENGKYKYRPCKIEWFDEIIQLWEGCAKSYGFNMPKIFVKQLGTHLAKQMKLSDRHGGNIEEFPTHLQIREFPNQ